MVGPTEAVHPASNLGFLAVLERLQVEHAARACYSDPVTGQSPCWDASLDGLLTDDCPVGPGPLGPGCLTLRKRSVYHVHRFYAETAGMVWLDPEPATPCGGALVVYAAHNVTAAGRPGELVLLIGRWGPLDGGESGCRLRLLGLPGLEPREATGTIETVLDSGRGPAVLSPPTRLAVFVARGEATLNVSAPLQAVVRVRLEL